jgi:hypothetical protein
MDSSYAPRPLTTDTQVVELVGPAGVGKTAVLRAIGGRDPAVRAGVRINRSRQLFAVAWHALALTPASLDMLFTDARWVWPGLRHLGRLRTFPAEVEYVRTLGYRTILLDEGPVFSLGRLSVFQYANEGAGWLARQWSTELQRWSALLDGVVWLDAPNAVLAERIRQRPKAHQIKQGSEQEVFEFLDRYRAAYRDILARLTAGGRVRLVELDMTAAPVDHVAADILAALERWGAPPGAAATQRGP